ncbi:hypothetical protein IMG5_202410 [Ichthyophthirius multifiliis]|uniref:protein-disulfide reductase n=1 Tax=Ichthyophthirius multifiliis TaxID=5932 RepID=G0R637_ICHMU|nr:hypothetical protein IMG5_202410 [Ichthyophthirius multifiliis]EGR27060.1 hypothetical protein IMG5_202410 [Ichthyophthirius multifiliis]|eukprot:XP_004023944.1 hypothetical protein IMG5_202410 [Ichthyophthirius multifiliis]
MEQKVDQIKENNEFQLGSTFLGKNGLLDVTPLKTNKVTCLYFSASYCPPCQAFTPLLIDFYNEINMEDKVLEIILIPFDITEEEFKTYYKQMPWLAIPLGDERIKKFTSYFKIKAIPKLIILKPNGEAAATNGRMDVIQEGEDAFNKWKSFMEQ